MLALTVLDAHRLEAIEEQLRALLPACEPGMSTPEITARCRVLASVLQATRENLRVLERVSRSGAEAGPAWAR